MLRAVGFAQTPGVLGLATALASLTDGIQLVMSVWAAAGVVVALRRTLDVGTVKAILTVLVAMGLFFILGIGIVAAGLLIGLHLAE